jgi:hypothetical protein
MEELSEVQLAMSVLAIPPLSVGVVCMLVVLMMLLVTLTATEVTVGVTQSDKSTRLARIFPALTRHGPLLVCFGEVRRGIATCLKVCKTPGFGLRREI